MAGSLVKDTIVYSFSDIAIKLIAFLTFPIFTNLLSINDYGQMSLIQTVSGLTGMIMGFGIMNSLQRYYFDDKTDEGRERKKLVTTCLFLIGMFCFIGYVIFGSVIYIFRYEIELIFNLPFTLLLIAIAGNIPSQIILFVFGTIRVQFKPFKYLVVSFINNLSGTILAIIFLYQNMGLFGYFLGFLLAPLFFVPIALLFIKRDLGFAVDNKLAKKIIAYGYPFIFAGVGYWLFGSIDRWVLNSYVGKESIGIYSVAFKFAFIVYLIITAFGQALSPLCVKMMVDEPERVDVYLSEILTYLYTGMTIIGLGIAFFSNELIVLTTPIAYWPAAKIVPIVICALVIHSSSLISVLGIYFSKRTNIMTLCVFISAAVNILFNFLLVPVFGPLGSALSLIITYGTLTISYALFGMKTIHINYNIRSLIITSVFLGGGVVFSTLLGGRAWSWPIVFLKIVVYLLFIFGILSFKIVDLSKIYRSMMGTFKR